VVISISADLITSYYDARAGISTGSTSPSSAALSPSNVANLVPPWQSTSTAPQQSALVSSVLNGGTFFNPSASQLTAPSVANASDYKNLFALYQGINALQGLATQAGAANVTQTQQQSYAKAFTAGLSQLQTFLGQTSFKTLDVSEGTLTASSTTTEGAPQETDTYTTGTVFAGAATDPVPALQGDVSFSMTLTNTAGVGKTVNFNLDDMGSTPRTMGNVVNYLNSQLSAAGATTRFADVATAGTPETTTVNGQTVNLTTPPSNYALEIKGTSTEAVTFSAPTTAPAVYVTAASGTAATAATSTSAATPGDQTQQLLKFTTGANDAQAALVNNTALSSAVSSALATATAPDGSVYVLANVDGTVSGQTINGSQDVALMKYDSAGNLVYTRTLGAASSATGYALAVSADGSNVAVAGSVTGALDANDTGESATSTNSFVTDYNAEGDEQWTNTQASNAGDVATGVAFGADGSVYVTGNTQSALPAGGGSSGGQDIYVRGYSPTGQISFTQQYGTSGNDSAGGIAVSGSSIYVAGAEGGDAVVRQFNIGTGGAVSAGTVRDLGALQGGNVVGVAVNSDGSVTVGGSTHNGALAGGTVQTAYQGGREGFVATLAANLQPGAGDSVSYIQAAGDLTATALTSAGGQTYLAGTVATTAPAASGLTGTSNGYVAAVDQGSGQVSWSQTFQGADDKAAPTAIAVSQTGASVLDQLGLPTSVDYSQSTLLVDNTSLRVGDSFSVQSGGSLAQPITIEADDTLQTLAQKIERATGFTATVTTSTINGETQLKIAPANSSSSIQILSGPTGSDALSALGLKPGEVSNDVNLVSTPSRVAKATLGLNLTNSLNLNSATAISQAQSALALAAAKIENTYQTLVNPTSSSSSTSQTTSAADAAGIAYINARTANYQLALSRLTGSS
jgi:hypothetical protein